MILPCTTAAFTLPQWSGWASSCGADSPWGSALICSFPHRLLLGITNRYPRHMAIEARRRNPETELGWSLPEPAWPETGRRAELLQREKQPKAFGESDHLIVCAGQRINQEGSSPSGARMRGAVSKSGGNASLAGMCG